MIGSQELEGGRERSREDGRERAREGGRTGGEKRGRHEGDTDGGRRLVMREEVEAGERGEHPPCQMKNV